MVKCYLYSNFFSQYNKVVLDSMTKTLKKEKKDAPKASKNKQRDLKKSLAFIGNSAKSQMADLKNANITQFIRGIGFKLFVLIFVSIVICVVSVGTVSYQQAKGLIESNVSNASMQTINQVSNSIDIVMNSYIDTSFQIMFDTTFTENVAVLQTTDNTYDLMRATRVISEKLSTFMVTNSTIKNIAIIPTKDNVQPIVSGSLTSSSLNPKDSATFKATDWYKAAEEKSGIAHWIEPQADGIIEPTKYQTIGLARMVKNMTNLNLSFMLVIEFNTYSFFEAATKVNFGNGSEVIIANGQNTYVLANNAQNYGSAPNIALPESEESQADVASMNLQGANGNTYLAVYDSLVANEDWKIIGAIPVENLAEQAAPILTLTIITSIIAGIIALAIGFFVILAIGRPLAKLSGLMQKGANGDLTVRSSTKSRRDEIGMLSNNFNEMMEHIQLLATQTTKSAAEVLRTAAELTDASQKTAVAAKEIAVATDEIANGASSLAVEAEKGTDLTHSINNQMQQIGEYSAQMSHSAQEVEHASQQGTSYMGVLIEKTGTTEQMTRAMVDKVNALQESTTSIVKILDVLNAVTKQTNILSLNATIEAARAGVAGRGFMVVADEIRQLADQSKNSIEIVAQITNKISQEIGETVQVLSEAYPVFQEQIGSVKEANQLFLSVQGQMDMFKDSMQQVTDSLEELNTSQAVLSDSMNNVSAVAQQSSATSEEVAGLSSEQLSISSNLVDLSNQLQTVSNGLKDSLSKFKIQ